MHVKKPCRTSIWIRIPNSATGWLTYLYPMQLWAWVVAFAFLIGMGVILTVLTKFNRSLGQDNEETLGYGWAVFVTLSSLFQQGSTYRARQVLSSFSAQV